MTSSQHLRNLPEHNLSRIDNSFFSNWNSRDVYDPIVVLWLWRPNLWHFELYQYPGIQISGFKSKRKFKWGLGMGEFYAARLPFAAL